jgi:hypothetical protein
VIVTDDLDGSADAQTVEFSLKGATYEIDLASKSLAALEKALKPYIDAGTRVSSRGRSVSARRRKSTSGVDLAAVRTWAAKNGHQVAARGRVSEAVMNPYNASK